MALATDSLARDLFGEAGMLGYVAGVQRREIRDGIACVKHQTMPGSDIGDDHKEYCTGEAALSTEDFRLMREAVVAHPKRPGVQGGSDSIKFSTLYHRLGRLG